MNVSQGWGGVSPEANTMAAFTCTHTHTGLGYVLDITWAAGLLIIPRGSPVTTDRKTETFLDDFAKG